MDKLFVSSTLLGTIYPAIGIDKPENHDDIVDFIVDDIKATADPEEWHSGDISIAFRRFLESHPHKTEEESVMEEYYQPEFKEGKPPVSVTGNELFSFEVYRDKNRCEKDFPNSKILKYSPGDIENPTFVDEE